ncbi:MAG: M28 family peptidase [Acidobacteria bacterium]|nr:M28 family peptidase [Acidobacteriota bacterium]
MRLFPAVCLFTASLSAQDSITSERIRAHVKFLASDLLEGRGVGTRGGDLTTEYIASQFAVAGLKPAGDNGTYFQRVDLVGVEPQTNSFLGATNGKQDLAFPWMTGFVGNTMRQQSTSFDAEAVFVGHGITAPEFQWNDYKDADLKGKIAVLFTNEPQSEDPGFFGGRALTYYGRWTYKYEEVLRQGAAGVVIIHTTPTAGYGWEVVKSSWSKEDPQVKLDGGEGALAFAGWISRQSGDELMNLAGQSVDDLLKKSAERDFRPIPLNLRIRGRVEAKVRNIRAANVAGIVPGSDPALAKQAVVFSAHWDHLGVGIPVNGDSIYNGAVDNASGCGLLIELARAWAGLNNRPRRSALFVAVTAEESGLRGAQFYAAKPYVPMGQTALNLNFDSFFPFGKVRDVVVNGAERTSVFPVVENAARRFNLRIKPDPRPEQGHYYRSDHFAFARAGVPAFSINMGDDVIGKEENAGAQLFYEYNAKNYHQPSDQYNETWDMGGAEQMAKFGFAIGLTVANQPNLPTWREGDEFLPARQRSLRLP